MFSISQKSFTLVETLVAISVFSLILIVTSMSVVTAYRAYRHIWQQSLAIGEARRGLETMVKEIREARPGDDGSYPIVKADDKEFIFFSDIDKDGETERVRYFLGFVSSGSITKESVTFIDGGACVIVFSDFLQGELKTASAQISVEGDFGNKKEYAEAYVDGRALGRICERGCSDCAGVWQGTNTFDVADEAFDDFIQFEVDANSQVDSSCNWQEESHAMKVKIEIQWTEELSDGRGEFRKGVINPTLSPIEYPLEQEEVSILSYYIRNSPPIFEYYDSQGEKIENYPARLEETRIMKAFLIVDVDTTQEPEPFELKTFVYPRNL